MTIRILNRSGLADALAVAPTTVDAWVRRGCPSKKQATGRGSGKSEWQFDLPEVVEWLREEAVQNAVGDIAKIDADEARRRKLAAEAALAEYDLAEKRKEMIRVEDAAEIVSKEYLAARSRFLAIPTKLGPMLAAVTTPEEAADLLRGAIEEALSELASADLGDGAGGADELPRDAPSSEGARLPAAAAPHGERVGRPKPKAQSRSKR